MANFRIPGLSSVDRLALTTQPMNAVHETAKHTRALRYQCSSYLRPKNLKADSPDP
jgi:hypothetical protein